MSYRAIHFVVMMDLTLSMFHDRPPVTETVLSLTQGDGWFLQTLELKPATSCFLILSCCFIVKLALWGGHYLLACKTALGYKSCFSWLHPSHGC